MIGRQIAHYYIIRVLGRGGMGVVYEAQDTRLPRSVALKLLSPGRVNDRGSILRFKREAQVASSLNHRNICTVFDADENDGYPYIAMELLEGMSLKARLVAGPVSLHETLHIATSMTDALAAAHARGIAHRDLSPGNIFLCSSGEVKLLDFGLAKQFVREEGDESDGLTGAWGLAGTIHYMAPEQLAEDSVTDHRCDLFALGAVLYQLATGVRPFEAPSRDMLLSMIRGDAHVPVQWLRPEQPPELARIIDTLLAKRPEDRYQTAAAVRERLSAIQGVAARPTRQTPHLPSQSMAVLPFASVGNASDQTSAFREGLVEDIWVQLAGLDGIRVAPRVSTRAVATLTARAIGQQLGVSLVVEGSLQQAGDALRVIATVVDTADEAVLGEPVVVDAPGDLTLDAQKTVARAIVDRLAPQLPERRRTSGQESEASHAFKRGQHLWVASCYSGGWRGAIEHFQHAVTLKPDFVPAHVALARAYNFLGYYCLMRPQIAFSVARQSAERALAIDGYSAAACAEMASSAFGRDWDWLTAESLFRRALELNPSDANARIYYSWLLALVGRTDAGLEEASAAVALMPEAPVIVIGRAHALYVARQFDEAIDICTAVLETMPQYVFALHIRGLCHLCKSMGPQAIADFEAVASLTLRTPFYLGLLGLCYGEFGPRDKGLELLAELNDISKDAYVHPQCYTFVYAGLGRQEKLEFQERAYEHGASPLNYLTPYVRELYNLDPTRSTYREQMRLIV